jgi:hypothetical protein
LKDIEFLALEGVGKNWGKSELGKLLLPSLNMCCCPLPMCDDVALQQAIMIIINIKHYHHWPSSVVVKRFAWYPKILGSNPTRTRRAFFPRHWRFE